MSEDLRTASWGIVPDIMKVLQPNFPDSLATYYTLRSYWRWKTQVTPDLDVQLLTPDGKADNYGTFVLYVPAHRNFLIFDSLHPDPARLKRLFINCELIDWSKKIIFSPIHEKFMEIIEEVLKIKNKERSDPDFVGEAFYLERESALKVTYDCPPEAYVAPLKVEDAELVDSVWPHRGGNSVQFISYIIRNHGGVGVYLKETNELVSWALLNFYFGPGFLQTVESHKRKGYGIVAAKAITKLVGEKGAHCICFIHDENTASQNLFLRMGYTKVYSVRIPWIK